MSTTMSSPWPLFPSPKPRTRRTPPKGWRADGKRVLAIGLVVSMHLVLLGLLYLPQAVVERAPPDLPDVIVEFQPSEPPPVREPPPPPITPPPIVPRNPAPITPPPVAAVEVPVQVAPSYVDPEPSETVAPSITVVGPTNQPTNPVAANTSQYSALRYRFAPPPDFPRRLLRAGKQGKVGLRVLVGVDGRAKKVEILNPSAYREFNQAALSVVKRRWRFEPAERDGRAIEVWGKLEIRFTID